MRNAYMILFVMVFSLSAVLTAPPAQGDEIDDLKAAFKQRYPKLLVLMDAGAIGERWDGYVEVRTSVDDDAKALIEAENNDRRRLYEIIAEKRDIEPKVVGALNGTRNFKDAKPEHWLKLKSGEWAQKKNVEIEE